MLIKASSNIASASKPETSDEDHQSDSDKSCISTNDFYEKEHSTKKMRISKK